MSWPVKINDIKKIQIESTNYCNARCSACHREEILLGQQQPNILGINNNYISFEQFVSWFDKDDFSSVDLFDFSGNIDEPTTNPDLLDILKWLFKADNFSKNMQVNIATNGGTRNKDFWKKLANISADNKFTTKDYRGYNRLHVIFGIDGLEDTNHIYRKNVKWKKLQKNFRIYIAEGGRASWQFIYFDHNKHQDKRVKQRSIEEGFEKMKWRKTVRNKKFIDDKHPPQKQIKCKALYRQDYFGLKTSLYITNKGHVMPCCWLGTELRMKEVYDKHGYKYDINDNVLNGIKSVQDILDSDWYDNLYDTIMAETWKTCTEKCKVNVIDAITDDFNKKG
tara:strand:- start:879 stop:1889 length:1011 start_codon:yes stop_codon:yes gene_type:complete